MCGAADILFARALLLGLSVITQNAIDTDRLAADDRAAPALIRQAQESLYTAHQSKDCGDVERALRQMRTLSDYLLRMRATEPCVCPAQVGRFLKEDD